MPYRLLPHTADAALEITARSPADLYAEALRALTDQLVDIVTVHPVERREIVVRAADTELLLVEWLQEVLARFEVEHLLFVRAEVTLSHSASWVEVRAVAHGETFDPFRHPPRSAVKAINYHDLRIWEDVDGWHARVVLDL